MSHNNSYSYGRFKKTLLAASIMAIGSAAYAADQPKKPDVKEDGEIEELLVTSVKRNLASAQELKKESGIVLDSITSEDLGDFPDKSIAEALQRVPGVTVSRFSNANNTSQFSAEPSGVIVRGLHHVRSEFNGRDSFSATSGRGLSWSDVSPELMSGVDIYKSQSAELIEGGIAGVVNLRTRLPFDRDGESLAYSLGTNYNETSGDSSPELSGVYSNRLETTIGEFGIMANIAYSDVNASSQGQGRYGYVRYNNIFPDANGNTEGTKFLPTDIFMNEFEYERERLGGALALQWQDDEGKYLASLQYNRSNYKNTNSSNQVQFKIGNNLTWPPSLRDGYGPDRLADVPKPPAGEAPFTFDENGAFMSGVPNQPHGFFGGGNAESATRKQNALGEHMVLSEGCGWSNPNGGCSEASGLQWIANTIGTSGSFSTDKEMIQDLSFNFKWNVTDRAHLNFDFQKVDATLESYRMGGSLNTYANTRVDLSGDEFKVILENPYGINPTGYDTDVGIFGTKGNYTPVSLDAGRQDGTGDEFATKVDFVFDVENGYIDKLKAGVRYADREQNVNSASGLWAPVWDFWADGSGDWSNLESPAAVLTRRVPTLLTDGTQAKNELGENLFHEHDYHFKGYPVDDFIAKEWSNEWGNLHTYDGINKVVFPDPKKMGDWENTMSGKALGTPNTGYISACSRKGVVPGTCYKPNESLDVSEVTEAAYVQMNFGGDDLTLFGRPLTGNLGVRYVKTEIVSSGGQNIAELGPDVENGDPEEGAPENFTDFSLRHYLSEEESRFVPLTNSGTGFSVASSTAIHHNVLPSFNLKYQITDKFQSRLAWSRAMSRPDIGLLRNYIEVRYRHPENNVNDPSWVLGEDGKPVGANLNFSANAANPYLKPTVADQIDFTLEYYFSRVGNVSAAVFDKKFDDYIQNSNYSRAITHNGVTRDVFVGGPVNGDGASLQGIELQGTFFLNFLPQPFDGFGVQANYTHIENKGIESSGLSSDAEDGSAGGLSVDVIEVTRLEGLSDDSYNVNVFYDKNDFSARVAYNWRSEFLITAADCCMSYPVWGDAYGQVDASVNYKFNDNYFVSLGISNLNKESMVTSQQVEDESAGGLRLPSSVAKAERRYTLSLRANF
ncbi:MAG: TonB-dependent receptor [Cellvibrio sp.]|uniref:TonB-dependent receptor n=1 Tax=Cellvibrio sp. TaxID=1965322 RepID=UPI00271C6F18|nr:TonB-dependent receptor [Cellvibrio sp.]